jgi:hypothetical protein
MSSLRRKFSTEHTEHLSEIYVESPLATEDTEALPTGGEIFPREGSRLLVIQWAASYL